MVQSWPSNTCRPYNRSSSSSSNSSSSSSSSSLSTPTLNATHQCRSSASNKQELQGGSSNNNNLPRLLTSHSNGRAGTSHMLSPEAETNNWLVNTILNQLNFYAKMLFTLCYYCEINKPEIK